MNTKPLILKPCPLCGHKKITVYNPTFYGDSVFVVCNNCECSTGPYGSRRSAIRRWNKRVK